MENVTVNAEQTTTAPVHSGSLMHFLDNADGVIWCIVILLLSLSVISWAILIHKTWVMRRVTAESKKFENYIWSQKTLKKAISPSTNAVEHSSGRVFLVAQNELPDRWEQSDSVRVISLVERAMSAVLNRDMEIYRKNLPFLASISSSATLIGLLGTVWGIMNSFSSIAQTQNTSLAVVAPGIAEALFVTSLGIFTAIPAFMGYNKLSADINRYGRQVEAFMDDIILHISREAK